MLKLSLNLPKLPTQTRKQTKIQQKHGQNICYKTQTTSRYEWNTEPDVRYEGLNQAE